MSDNEDEVQEKTIKITIIGEPGTGKTTLCHKYLGNNSTVVGSTHGAEVTAGQCFGLRPPVPFQLCDVAGNALDTAMFTNYLYTSDIIIFVYDLTNLQSFENLEKWVATVHDISKHEPKKALMALFGNKCDLEHQRAVRLSCVEKFASKHLLENFKGSARTGENVNDVFTNLVALALGMDARATVIDRKPSVIEEIEPGPSAPPDNAYPLIMNRKTLRKIQRKESSSICVMQ